MSLRVTRNYLVDGEIVMHFPELAAFPGLDQGVAVNWHKAAVDRVWYLLESLNVSKL